MTITIILFLIVFYLLLNINKILSKKDYVAKDIMDNVHSRIAKANGASNQNFSLENSSHATQRNYMHLYKNADFVNKNCTSLEDFIINDQVSSYDLMKLADLNGIHLQIPNAWYPITIELVKELNDNGWDKRVSCIKEKYASLRFYTGQRFDGITDKYEHMSEHICQTCGETGEIRNNSGWDRVACRKHYMEDRGKITLQDSGFTFNGDFYKWKEIRNAVFEDLDYYGRYRFLTIEMNGNIVKHPGWKDNKLYVQQYVIGYGNFLNQFSQHSQHIDLNYTQHYKDVSFCEICGYQAVYHDRCECCEYLTWEGYKKQWDDADEKLNHIKSYQMFWFEDNGELYESQAHNYPKNPDHKILFTEEELADYLNPKDEI
ncbi:MAG: hypothetical protein QM710_03020 [Flavobacterium sp.]